MENFDLGERFLRPGPSNGGACAPRARRVAVLHGDGCGRGSTPPAEGVPGCHPWKFCLRFLMPNPAFGSGNKLIESQPNEYDVICRNASVLAFHLWPTIFAVAPFRQIFWSRNGDLPRSRTTTPLVISKLLNFLELQWVDFVQLLAVHDWTRFYVVAIS